MEKRERNSDKERGKRFGLSKAGVKGVKARLRKKDPYLYVRKRAVKSQQVDKSTNH